MSNNIQVAVRVRPFNTKEEQTGTKCVVQMTGNTVCLLNTNVAHNQPKNFTFDHAFWSHDGYEIIDGYMRAAKPKYVDQEKMFLSVGKDLLGATWEGYNCSLFAYGQTGSGKSYTVMGNDANRGLIPQICQSLFYQINGKKTPTVKYEVTFSMCEIYNEKIRDLLVTKKDQKPLVVKENMEKSFYIPLLTTRPVDSYPTIEVLLKQGNQNKSIGSTNMNNTSSRSHTIVTITFRQNDSQTKMTKTSLIHLVDLAGSERQSKTGATGDRFEESKNINKSLSALGNVISTLCSGSNHVPYRDSSLTKLLKNSLGGNCKTIMIATISPSSYNYDESLSTLRYADRAKHIKNHAKVNESETDKLVKELLAEKERLLKELELSKRGSNQEELDELKHEIKRQNDEIEGLNQSWEKRLMQAHKETDEKLKEFEAEKRKRKETHYLWNLNEDPSLCNKIIHFIDDEKLVGNNDSHDIVLRGPTILPSHARVKVKEMDGSRKIYITPLDGKVYLNGKELKKNKEKHIRHNDRVCFGASHIFILNDPSKKKQFAGNYEEARNEMSETMMENLKADDEYLRQQILELFPHVQEANSICEICERNNKFELILVSGEARGQPDRKTEAYVKYINSIGTKSQLIFIWAHSKFIARHGRMMELYYQYEDSGTNPLNDIDPLEDPFYEADDLDCFIGIAALPLISLTMMLPYEEEEETSMISILDYEAVKVGSLEIALVPCDKHGDGNVDYGIEDSDNLKDLELHFKVKILAAYSLPKPYYQSWCQFRFFNQSTVITPSAKSNNPQFKFQHVFTIKKGEATSTFVEQLTDGYLFIELWGHQSFTLDKTRSTQKQDPEQGIEIARLKVENLKLREALEEILEIADRGSQTDCDQCESAGVLADISYIADSV